MCGLVGFISDINNGIGILGDMLNCIKWRGPDGSGVWNTDLVYLGHNRLSILDLSSTGGQPMVSADGRFVIAYNGEIYNYKELKSLFPLNFSWRGSSDTEVILNCIERFGIHDAVRKFSGIFAFAVYDLKERKLFLVRDQIGVKPLYYGITGNSFLFGSQIKTFTKFPGFERKISKEAMQLFFKYNAVPAPYAIYENCYKVQPGTIVEVQDGKVVSHHKYWSMEECIERGSCDYFKSEEEAVDAIETAIKENVRRQLVSDVPVGAFLSGGIDSSMVSCFSKKFKPDLKTFSIGFEEKNYDESSYARSVANYLGTNHIERKLSATEALSIIPNIPEFCDEPLNDSSQIPTYFVSKLASEHVKVVVSGDGGDELFAGYSRYTQLLKLRMFQKFVPMGNGIVSLFNKLPGSVRGIVGRKLALKLCMAETYLKCKEIRSQYDSLFNFWPEIFGDLHFDALPAKAFIGQSDLSYMCYHDCKIYLPDVILTKVDRSSMYASIESRVPLLEHSFYELSCRVPDHWKLNGWTTKSILKKILYKHIPKKLIDRPKMGFGVPIDLWIRRELKDWAMSLLSDIKLESFLPFNAINQKMVQHQKGITNWQYALWAVLIWQQWKNHYNADY